MGNILKDHGFEPAPELNGRRLGRPFSRRTGMSLGAIDFTTVEVWTKGGLVTFYLLFVMELATRRVHFAGCTVNPTSVDEADCQESDRCREGFLNGKRYLIMDRDGKFCPRFRRS